MKNIFYILITAMACASCSGGAGKFVGKWRNVDTSYDKGVLTIEKQDGQYVALNSARPDRPAKLIYDEKAQTLTAQDGADFQIRYVDSSKHLLLVPKMFGSAIEFQKDNR